MSVYRMPTEGEIEQAQRDEERAVSGRLSAAIRASIEERDELRAALELLLDALEEARLGSGRGNDAIIFSSDIRDGIRAAREALGEGRP